MWQGTGYRPLPDADPARRLFDFAAVPWPETFAVAGAARPAPTVGGLPREGPGAVPAFCWGAHVAGPSGERLVGAIVAEQAAGAGMLHGPVVAAETPDALEMAAQLVAAALDHASALGVQTIFARPQGLDRIWIRHGFIPVPEGALPPALGGRQGVGLYAWRGGTALWTFRERPND